MSLPSYKEKKEKASKEEKGRQKQPRRNKQKTFTKAEHICRFVSSKDGSTGNTALQTENGV
jgi:hypothetical protein